MSRELNKAIPAYLRIEDELRRQIENGQFQPGEQMLTEREICEKYGVSRITARRVLDDLAQQQYVVRIQGKGSFVNQPEAGRKTRRLALVFNGMPAQSTFHLILEAMEETAAQNDCQITFFNTGNRFERLREIADDILAGQFEGAIVNPIHSDTGYERNRDLIDQLEFNGIPIVLIQNTFAQHREQYSYVGSDNAGGVQAMMNHLIDELGHRRIALIHVPYSSSLYDRRQAYRAALAQHGIAYTGALERQVNAMADLPSVLAALMKPKAKRPTALFCTSDLLAYEALRWLMEQGYEVPQDVSLAGFDDLPASAVLAAPLTTVAQDYNAIGAAAVESLLARMEPSEFQIRRQVVLPCRLVVRQSCGPVVG